MTNINLMSSGAVQPEQLAQFWVDNREIFHGTDWTIQKRSSYGKIVYAFYQKCAWFCCAINHWTVEDYANELGCSISTASRLSNHFSTIYNRRLSRKSGDSVKNLLIHSKPTDFAFLNKGI